MTKVREQGVRKMDAEETNQIVQAAMAGQPGALEQLLEHFSPRLARLIALRLDPRMAARVDVEDVLQEVHLAAYRQREDFLHHPEIPPYVWLRAVAVNRLLELHRYHLGTQKRDARREVSVHPPYGCPASTSVMANHFVDSGTSPSRAAMRAEMKAQLETCLDQLPTLDQEVLALRHIEQLDPQETAQVLQLTEKAASMRYLRALRRMKTLFDAQGGNSSALRWNH